MASHNSSDWLYVSQNQGEWSATCGDSLRRITTSLSDPHTQFPSVVLLVGRHEKEVSQRAMFASVNYHKPRGLTQLNADVSTFNSECPLLVATLDIDTAYSKFHPPRKTSKDIGYRIEWLPEQQLASAAEPLIDTFISKVILSFTDVVCLFLDDFQAPEEGNRLLQRWSDLLQLRQPWQPRVIVVTSRGQLDQITLSTLAFGDLLHIRLRTNVKKHTIHHRYRALKTSILQSTDAVRKRRIDCNRLFSASHLNVLFELNLQHVASRVQPDFDFIVAARQLNPIDDYFTYHLDNFLELCKVHSASDEFILHYLASVIILDSLPPGMHRKFPSYIKEYGLIFTDRFCGGRNFRFLVSLALP
jgi:hypothetical protein